MKLQSNKKIFYGWYVIIACFFMTFVALGLGNSTKGLFITPVTEDLGISRGLFSITFSIRELVKAFANLLFGVLSLRLGLRKLAAVGFGALAVSFALFSVSSSLIVFYFAGLFLGVGITMTSTAMVSSLVRNWFVRYRGTIMGVIFAGSGLGGSLFSLLVGQWIDAFGWRTAYLIIAVIMACMMIPMIAIIRNTPEEKGLTALGAGETVKEKKHKTREWTGLSLHALLRQPYFYLAAFGALFFGLGTNPVVVSFPSHLTDVGFDAAFAARISSIECLALAAAKILVGVIYDRAGLRAALAVCLGSSTVGCLLLSFVSQSWMAYAFAVIIAFSLPLETLMIPLVLSDLFGQKSYSHLLGLFLALMSAGIAIGTPLLNFCYDITGSYHLAFLWIAILAMVVLVALLWCCRKADRLHAREEQGETLE